MKTNEKNKIREMVRKHYGKSPKPKTSDCGCSLPPSCCGTDEKQTSKSNTYELFGYSNQDVADFYGGKNAGLCCGNPIAIASIQPGEIVLDLGCGTGFDCYLAAKQVGDTGHVIGVDMTPEVLSRTRQNLTKSEFQNVEFRLGEIEHLPVADNSIDVIISNCVINLSPDKPSVFREAFRVLKSEGRLCISDIIATALLPDDLKNDKALYCNCISGTMLADELKDMLKKAGFQEIRITPKDESQESIREWAVIPNAANFVVSANIEAIKP